MREFKTWEYEYQDDYIYELYKELSEDTLAISNIARNLFDFIRKENLLDKFKEFMIKPINPKDGV